MSATARLAGSVGRASAAPTASAAPAPAQAAVGPFAKIAQETVRALRADVKRRVAPLVRRIEALEAENEQLKSDRTRYRGVFSRVEAYSRGDFVTKDGQLWICVRPVTGSMGPGTDVENWVLMAKSPQAEKVEALERRIASLENPNLVPS